MEECQSFIDHAKYTNPVLLDTEESRKAIMAKYLKVDRILVANSIHNQSKKQDVADLVSIWPDNFAMLAKVATQPRNLKEPCLGAHLPVDRHGCGTSCPRKPITSLRPNPPSSGLFHHTDERFVFEACGYLS